MTSPWKEAQVKQISEKVKSKPVVGVVTMRNLPAKQLQKMRVSLPAELFMARKNLIVRSLEEANLKKLNEYVGDQPAIILTDENPFKLYKQLQDGRISAPAKGGDISPRDILIEKGETPFAAGPVLGELKLVGIPCAIEKGKIAVTANKVIVKKGETISAELASILTRLGIEPMEIGLDLLAAAEKGQVFLSDLLAIDEDEYMANIRSAFQCAFNLSVESAFPTKSNIDTLLQKAFTSSKAISLEAGIVTKATVGDLIAKAQVQAQSLASLVPEKTAEAPKVEEKKDEKAAEEPKEEAKTEEAPAEEKKEEKPAEEKKEEGQPEEVKAEEAKPEEKPAEEPKAEEQAEKVEEKPAEEAPKEEAKPEKAPAEEPEKVEEPKEASTEEKKEEKPAEEAKPAEEQAEKAEKKE